MRASFNYIKQFVVSGFFILLMSLICPNYSLAQVYTLIDSVGQFKNPIKQVIFHPEGKMVATITQNSSTIFLYQADSNKLIKKFDNTLATSINNISFNGTGKLICASYNNGSVGIFDTKKGTLLKTFYPNGKILSTTGLNINFAVLNGSDDMLYFGGEDKQITQVKNPLKMSSTSVIATTTQAITTGCSNQNKTMIVYSANNLLYIRDLISGKLTVLTPASDYITSVAFANDGQRIAAKCKNRLVDFWNYKTGEKVKIIKDQNRPILEDYSGIALSNDNRYIAVGAVDALPSIWDDDYRQLYNLVAHKDRVGAVDFSQDSKMIATGSDDGTVYIWYITDGQYTQDQIKNFIRNPEMRKVSEKKLLSPDGNGEATISFSGDNIPLDINGRNIKPTQTVIVKGKNLTFYVWDDDQVDGDIISIYFNNQWILSNAKLAKKKRVVTAKIDPSSNNYIMLFAHNEGSIPPNTCGISIFDGYKETRLTMKSDLKSCDAVRLVFKGE